MDNQAGKPCICTVLSITTDPLILQTIQDGYATDKFCKKVTTSSTPDVSNANGLWYIGNQLLIPHTGSIWEDLFCPAHNASGHFGADKSYATLHNAYYWQNMRRDL